MPCAPACPARPPTLRARCDRRPAHGREGAAGAADFARWASLPAQVGLAYCDNTLKIIGVVEFLDGDQLCNLEAALVRLGARECVAVEEKVGGSKAIENKKVKEVLQRCDVVLTERKSSDFNAKDIEQVCVWTGVLPAAPGVRRRLRMTSTLCLPGRTLCAPPCGASCSLFNPHATSRLRALSLLRHLWHAGSGAPPRP